MSCRYIINPSQYLSKVVAVRYDRYPTKKLCKSLCRRCLRFYSCHVESMNSLNDLRAFARKNELR